MNSSLFSDVLSDKQINQYDENENYMILVNKIKKKNEK
jgi:hypothetical protein